MSRRSESTPASLLPALQTHLWFAACPAEFQAALIERSRLWHLSEGETLFARGELNDGLCCVVAGALKLGSADPRDGNQRLTLYVEPYHWFGEISVIDGLPRSQEAVADTDSTVLVVPGLALHDWLNAHPLHWRDIARLLCGKMRLGLMAMEDAATLPFEQQLARRLLMSVTNYGQSTLPGFKRHLRLPQEYLARMLGVSRQTVNKSLRALARDGVLSLHYAEIEILDMAALAARAGPLDPGLLGQGLLGPGIESSGVLPQRG